MIQYVKRVLSSNFLVDSKKSNSFSFTLAKWYRYTTVFFKTKFAKHGFQTLFFKSVGDTLQTICFANKVFVFETHRRYTTVTLFRK